MYKLHQRENYGNTESNRKEQVRNCIENLKQNHWTKGQQAR